MSALTVLLLGVSLVFGLQAADDGNGIAAMRKAGLAAIQQHDYNAAAALFGTCVERSKTDAERVTSLTWYGIAMNRMNRFAEARTALEGALAEWKDTPETPAHERIAASSILASADRKLGDYQSAEKLLRKAMAESSALNEQRAMMMVDLADLLREQTRETEAAAVLNEAGRLTGLSPQQETNVMMESAELSRDMGDWNTSVALWSKIGDVARSENSPHLEAIAEGGLGDTWLSAGNLARAEPLLRRSLQLLREDPAASLSQVATALAMMVRVYLSEDKLALAEEALDEAIAKDESILGPKHPQMALLLELRATIQSRRGETDLAREDLDRSRLIMSGNFGPESMAVAGVFAALGDVEQRANRPEAAVQDYAAAVKMLREAGSDSMRFEAAFVGRYAAALKAAHRPDEARALLKTLQSTRGHDAPAAEAETTSALAGARSFRDK